MCYKPPGAESSIVVTPAWCLWCRCVLWVLSRIFDQLDEWSDRSPNGFSFWCSWWGWRKLVGAKLLVDIGWV